MSAVTGAGGLAHCQWAGDALLRVTTTPSEALPYEANQPCSSGSRLKRSRLGRAGTTR